MKNATKYIIDGLKMISILAGAFLLCLLLETKFSAETVPPAVMAMAVFFVSRFTDGFVYGIIASLLSVLVLNFAFAFPFAFPCFLFLRKRIRSNSACTDHAHATIQ